MKLCALHPPHSLWALRTSAVFLIRNLVRTHQGGLLLTTPVIFGTVAGDPPNNHVYMDAARMDGLGQAFQPLISRAKLSQSMSFPSLGRAIFELF